MTFTATPKLSKTSKLDGILSWSLQALETCPASMDNGVLVPACSGCYATTGNYNYANVKAPRAHNKTDWQNFDWVPAMVAELDNSRYFRWFDSGDMYSLGLAEKILEVMQATPHVKHWLPTRMVKFPKFAQVIKAMQALPNVMVRFSSDEVDGSYVEGLHGSCIVPNDDTVTAAHVCRAYDNGGKCNGCRTCWDKDTPVVAYVAHGKKMAKVIRINKA